MCSCDLRTCMCVLRTYWNTRDAQLPFVWTIPPLLLFLWPPAALCCQVEPEGLALIMGKRLTVTLTQDVVMASPGWGRTGHASLPVAASWDNESYCRPSAAAALPTVPVTRTNNSVCVNAASSSLLLSYSAVTLLFLPLGPMLTRLPFRKMGHSSSGACKNIYKLD